jgi:hypothetical protein
MKEAAKALDAGHAALFLLIRKMTTDKVVAALAVEEAEAVAQLKVWEPSIRALRLLAALLAAHPKLLGAVAAEVPLANKFICTKKAAMLQRLACLLLLARKNHLTGKSIWHIQVQ